MDNEPREKRKRQPLNRLDSTTEARKPKTTKKAADLLPPAPQGDLTNEVKKKKQKKPKPPPSVDLTRPFQPKECYKRTVPIEFVNHRIVIRHCKDFFAQSNNNALPIEEAIEKGISDAFPDDIKPAYSEQPGEYAEVTFFHPYHVQKLLEKRKNWEAPFEDEASRENMTIQLSDTSGNNALWIGGWPNKTHVQTIDDEVEFRERIINEFDEQSREDFDFSECVFDRARRELVIIPRIKDENQGRNVAALTSEMLFRLIRHMSITVVNWKQAEHFLLMRSVDSKYVEMWKKRACLQKTQLDIRSLTWTTVECKKMLENHKAKHAKYKEVKKAAEKEKEEKVKVEPEDGEYPDNVASSSKRVFKPKVERCKPGELTVLASRKDHLLDFDAAGSSSQAPIPEEQPIYVHPKYQDACERWSMDKTLRRLFKKVISRKLKDGTFKRTVRHWSKFDDIVIKRALNRLGYAAKNTSSTTSSNKFIIECYPFSTPKDHPKIGSRLDTFGQTDFYDYAPNKETGELKKMPDCEFISESVRSEDPDSGLHRLKDAKNYEMRCSCDPSVGCLPETCECIRGSCLVNGRIDETRGDNIVVCCENCSCRAQCDNHVVITPRLCHVVNFGGVMGFAVRIFENVPAGTPLMYFDGEYVCGEHDGIWLEELLSMKVPANRESTGISDPTADSSIFVKYKGNISKFISHSLFSNLDRRNVYSGGCLMTEPRKLIYTRWDLEAGDILYIDYGAAFPLKDKNCLCTQELCRHHKNVKQWMNQMSYVQAEEFLAGVLKAKRLRMIQLENELLAQIYEEKERKDEKRKRERQMMGESSEESEEDEEVEEEEEDEEEEDESSDEESTDEDEEESDEDDHMDVDEQ